MKKNFFKKKLASGLALALVVASLAPAGMSASAASATKVVKQGGRKAPTIMYVGGAKVDYSLSKIYRGNKYTWSISDSSIATITKTTGVVTAKAPGKVTITCTARNSSGRWLNAFGHTIRVKLRSTSVSAGSEDFELASGATKDLNAVLTPSNSTDAVRYYSSDETVATVDAKTGVVTGVNPGEATITVLAKALWNSPKTSSYNKVSEVKVTVPFGVAKVEQTKAAEVKLTFNADAKDVKASDLKVVNDETKQVIAVKEVSAEGKVLTVKTFSDMTDGKVYTVTYNEKDSQFTATDNVVASLAFSTATIPYDTETTIKVSKMDGNGVVLGTYEYGSVTDSKLEFTVDTTKGYTNAGKLVLFNIGDTAKLAATYHTYKYDTNGNEVGAIKAETTVTAVDKSAVSVKETKYTVAKNAPDWAKLTTNNTKLAIEDQNFKLFFYAKKSNDALAVVGDYTFESSNPNVLIVSTDSQDLAANLVAVSQGSAYVLVKNTDGKVVWSLPVNIVGKRIANALILDSESAVLSNTALVADTKDITLTVKDIYGDEMDFASLDTPAVTLVTNVAPGTTTPAVTLVNNKVTVNAQNAAVGTYTYKVTLGKFTRTFTVSVVAPTNAASTYKLVLNNTAVDTKFTTSTKEDKNVEIKIAELKGGVLYNYVDMNTITPVIKKGTTVVATGSAISGSSIVFEALKLNTNTTKVVEKAASGSYTVEVQFAQNNSTYTLKGGFVITDTQSGLTATKVKESVAAGTALETAIAEAFTFTYEGSKLTIGSADITNVDKVDYVSGAVFVKTAYVNVPVGDYKVPVKVTFNSTILFK